MSKNPKNIIIAPEGIYPNFYDISSFENTFNRRYKVPLKDARNFLEKILHILPFKFETSSNDGKEPSTERLNPKTYLIEAAFYGSSLEILPPLNRKINHIILYEDKQEIYKKFTPYTFMDNWLNNIRCSFKLEYKDLEITNSFGEKELFLEIFKFNKKDGREIDNYTNNLPKKDENQELLDYLQKKLDEFSK